MHGISIRVPLCNMESRCNTAMNINSYISRQFSNPTGFGGKLVTSIMNRQNRPLYEETVRLLSPNDTDSILDIGCGNGYMLNMIARHCNGVLTGIDTSASILKEASIRNHAFTVNGKISLLCNDVSAMPFTDCSFTKAYSINTVYFWKNLNGVLKEIRRVLKPDGLFINTLYTNETLSRFSHTQFGYNRYKVDQLTKTGEDEGLIAKIMPALNGAAYCIIYTRVESQSP